MKGQKVAVFDLAKNKPADAELMELMLGTTGNLRAPVVVRGGTVLVGFAEDLVARGLLVVGLRDGGSSEWVVWVVTSVLFALLHAMNALFGQSMRTTVVQIVAAFAAGSWPESSHPAAKQPPATRNSRRADCGVPPVTSSVRSASKIEVNRANSILSSGW